MRQIYSPLDGFRSPFGRLMGSTAPFTPAVLFGASEPGVWYDPSDVANLAWRRNLLTFTEQFSNAIWLTSNMSKGSAQTDPLGGSTAIRISATGSNADFYQTVTVPAGTYVNSIWVRRVTGTGTVNLNTPSNTPVALSLTSSWQRFSASSTLASGGGLYIAIRIVTSGDAVDVAFAQSETGSVATDYQRISDVNTEVIERFPSATLYQDTAGTQPVTTPGQTVALALDKSKGLVLGSELVTNGDFSSGTGWSTGGGWTISSGAASIASSGNLTQNALALLAQNKLVKVTYTITSAFSGSGVAPFFQQTSPTSINVFGTYRTAVGTYTEYLQAPLNATVFGFNSGSTSGSIDNISVKELPGFHATQATLASRPTYGIVPLGGRRNLFERTEEFDNVYWAKSTSATVTANDTLSPNGTATADRLASSATLAFGVAVFRGPNTVVSGATYRVSCYMKAGTAGWGSLLFGDGGSNAARFNFNLSTEQLGSAETFGSGWTYVASSASIQSVGNGWLRCSAAFVAGGTSATVSIAAANANNSASITSGQFNYIWGAQLETGSSATAYQRVGSAFDVTEAGVASLSYLSFDGVDDFMVTPTITPGIDKAQVFAGVRKLSDPSTGADLVSTLDSAGANAGLILINAPGTSPSSYTFASKGTAFGVASLGSNTFPAPITNVVTGLGDISGDRATLRVNGAQVAQATTDQGTGNYLAYPIYIGRRAGTQFPFNGQIFSLIVRFGTNLDAGTITSTETWVGGKTGVTL